MTQNAINRYAESANSSVKVVVVESGVLTNYDNADVLDYTSRPFNYNQNMKAGVFHFDSSTDYTIMSNNDVIPDHYCVQALIKSGYPIISTRDPTYGVHKSIQRDISGYQTGYSISGWAITIQTKLLLRNIDRFLPDELPFYCQDSWIGDVARRNFVPIVLTHDAEMIHLGNQSHGLNSISKSVDSQVMFYKHYRQSNLPEARLDLTESRIGITLKLLSVLVRHKVYR
jgi:GT2 family glycosyltransferase